LALSCQRLSLDAWVQLLPPDTNEIIGARTVLERSPLTGRLVSLDAIHTQDETARLLVHDKGADCLLALKDNQPTLLKTAQTLRFYGMVTA
jgi:hypothetical protein